MENYFEKCRKYWAETIIKGALKYPEPQIIRFVKKNCKPGDTILDFGCGAGRDSLALSSEGYKMIAMDYNCEGLERIKAQDDKIVTVNNSGIEVPVADESVDAIFCDGSLFYNSKKETVFLLKNLLKALKPGGMMWADWRTKNDSLYAKGVCLGEDYYLLDDRNGATYCFYNEDELRKLYAEAGFEVVSVDVGSFTQNNRATLNEWYYVVAAKCK